LIGLIGWIRWIGWIGWIRWIRWIGWIGGCQQQGAGWLEESGRGACWGQRGVS
jgi:hypothetical protein